MSFRFSSETEDVIRDVSFEVRVGSIAAIVGPTGCGKSSLMNVIAGLYEPVSGQIFADIKNTAIVFQEPFLFSGSIRENICLDREVTEKQIENAQFVSAVSEFVNGFEAGLETLVGERE